MIQKEDLYNLTSVSSPVLSPNGQEAVAIRTIMGKGGYCPLLRDKIY